MFRVVFTAALKKASQTFYCTCYMISIHHLWPLISVQLHYIFMSDEAVDVTICCLLLRLNAAAQKALHVIGCQCEGGSPRLSLISPETNVLVL